MSVFPETRAAATYVAAPVLGCTTWCWPSATWPAQPGWMPTATTRMRPRSPILSFGDLYSRLNCWASAAARRAKVRRLERPR